MEMVNGRVYRVGRAPFDSARLGDENGGCGMLWGEATMRKWWTAAAMAAMWLGQTTTGMAQAPMEASGAGYMPEPMPVNGPAASNPLVAPQNYSDIYGPMNPAMAGMGHEGEGANSYNCYFTVGTLALRRQRLGHQRLAVLDAANGGLDTGNGPAINAPDAINFNDINPDFGWGVRATLGWQYGNDAWEISGFWIPDQDTTNDIANPGFLSALFFHPPIGFEGNNGLWLQADRITTSLRTQLGNAEINWRHFSHDCPGLQGLLGFRYFDLQERLGIFTDDDGLLIQNAQLQPDPIRQALYFTRVHSHILAGQIGFEYDFPIFRWLTFEFSGKGAWGYNYYDINKVLVRGDGFPGFSLGHHASTFSHMYEIGVTADFGITERLHFRAGYQALWVLHVPEASSQVSFDLANQFSQTKDDGSILYHGPIFEVRLQF